MLLYAALGESLLYIKGPVRETDAAWVTALEIAERLGDTDYQLRALYGLWACRNLGGDLRAQLAFAQRFCSLRDRARRIASGPEADPLDVVRLSSAERSRTILDGPVLRHRLHR